MIAIWEYYLKGLFCSEILNERNVVVEIAYNYNNL